MSLSLSFLLAFLLAAVLFEDCALPLVASAAASADGAAAAVVSVAP